MLRTAAATWWNGRMPDAVDGPFRPVLQDHQPVEPSYNVFSGVFPAILGGSVGATLGMLVIARRLQVPRAVQAALVGIGVLGVAIGVALALGTTLSNTASFRVGGLAAFAGQLPFLLRPFRAWQVRGDDVASFWGVGVAVTLVGVVASLVIGISVPGLRDTMG